MTNFNLGQRGFVILYAVLMVTIVLTISLSIFNITYKQLVISATGFDSQAAYYAALSAHDCVLFWDTNLDPNDPLNPDLSKYHPFGYFPGDGSFVGNDVFDQDLSDLKCGQQINDANREDDGRITSAKISYSPNGPCADFLVYKRIEDVDGTPQGVTTVTVNGYNLDCDSTSPRKVQRTVEFDSGGS